MIDLAAHWNSQGTPPYANPAEIRHPNSSPHAGVLAAAAHHPTWLRKMDGQVIPNVVIAGYQKIPWGNALEITTQPMAVDGSERRVPQLRWTYAKYPVGRSYAIPEWVQVG